MLLTQLLAAVFVIVGCCITTYVCTVNCYCITRDVEVNEDHLIFVVVFGVLIMCLIFILTLLSSVIGYALHLVS